VSEHPDDLAKRSAAAMWESDRASQALGIEIAQVSTLRDAIEVVASGADAANFQRSLPLEVALRPEVLLAWEMNGEPIPQANGGPVRMIVPGWAGIASVKWPTPLELSGAHHSW